MMDKIPESYRDFVAAREQALIQYNRFGKMPMLAFLASQIKKGNITPVEASYICREVNVTPPEEWKNARLS